MKRYELYYNDVVKVLDTETQKEINGYFRQYNYTTKQLKSNQAWVITLPIEKPKYQILQSYRTGVAIYNFETKAITCSGTYSATTRHHLGEFAKMHNLTYFDFKKAYEDLIKKQR